MYSDKQVSELVSLQSACSSPQPPALLQLGGNTVKQKNADLSSTFNEL